MHSRTHQNKETNEKLRRFKYIILCTLKQFHLFSLTGLIKAGSHEFPFRFHLVPPLPENYKDNICRVEYFVEARLKQDTNTKRDLKHRQRFQISDPTDLNTVILPDVTVSAVSVCVCMRVHVRVG